MTSYSNLTFLSLICHLLHYSSVNGVSLEDIFPYGVNNGDSQLPPNDDAFLPVPLVFRNFSYFNQTYDSLFVSNNGLLSFLRGVNAFTASCTPQSTPSILGFWGDVDTRLDGGLVHYRESNNPSLLSKVSDEIQVAFPDLQSSPQMEWIFIATWDNVSFYGSQREVRCPSGSNSTITVNTKDLRNTFQIVLTSDGAHSYAILNYNRIQWTTGTASGGGICTGLGGSPAKAGFDFGDGRTLYTIPGSCTPAISQLPETSNVDQPGKWVFRIDSAVDGAGCEGTSKVVVSPSAVNMLGQEQITLKGPCLTNYTSTRCRFEEVGRTVTVLGVISGDKKEVYCLTPSFTVWGRVTVRLWLSSEDTFDSYSAYLYTTAGLKDSLEIRFNISDNLMELEWDPAYFQRLTRAGPQGVSTLELGIVSVSMVQGDILYSPKQILKSVLSNTGTFSGAILDSVYFGPLKYYYLYLVLNDIDLFSVPKVLLSNLKFNTINKTVEYFQNSCDEWFAQDPGPPLNILPCPPTLALARMDVRYEAEDTLLSFYHPGAEFSYRQKIPGRDGSGQQCVYKGGVLLLGPPGGGTADLVSPTGIKGVVGHFLKDVGPWFTCCKFSQSEASCRKYYQKRPSDSGYAYIPPRLGFGVGDPHIVTMDGASYTFNGVGEYWMVVGPGLRMQGRTERFFSYQNGTRVFRNASVFTAFAFREADVVVQVALNQLKGTLDVLLNSEERVEPNVTYRVGGGVTIVTSNVSVEIAFSSQFYLEIRVGPESNSLEILSTAGETVLNKGYRGLLGNIDGIPGNDFTFRNGTVIPGNSSLRELHAFGISWATGENETLFYYPAGKGHSFYQQLDYEPNLVVGNPTPEVRRICGESRECWYDYETTGSAAFAQGTKAVVQEVSEVINRVAEGQQEVEMCAPQSNPKNGYFQATNFMFGSRAVFGCNEGFRVVGNRVVECSVRYGSHVFWNGTAPLCTKSYGAPKTCREAGGKQICAW